jgi:hypothetical protein
MDSRQSQSSQPSSGELDHARGRSTSNGHNSTSAPDGETPLPVPDREKPQPGLETEHQPQEVEAEKAIVRLLNALADKAEGEADQVTAEADETQHRADAEPERQQVSLWERRRKYNLLTLVVLVAIGLAVALFIISPWLFSIGLLIAATGGAVKRFGGREKGGPEADEEEGDP